MSNFNGFWMDFGRVLGVMLAPISTKNRSKSNSKHISKNISKKWGGGAREETGKGGGGVPYNHSIHPSRAATVDPLTLQSCHKGTVADIYIYIHTYMFIYTYIYIFFFFFFVEYGERSTLADKMRARPWGGP